MPRFSKESLLSQTTDKLRREPISEPLSSGIENFLPEKVMSRFSIENLMSHCTENFRRGTQ